MMGAAAVLAAPAIRPARAQAMKTLVFGGSVPLSGAAAETGLNVNNGYITAATYINEVMGGVEIAGDKYKVELKLFDDASDPARATTLIQRQIDDGTNFFLGSFGSNIVLPTAASGIFSAIMIGLGRAVGETMIVVMATGNTPILDVNIFNGLRTLSANINVELPEAVRDSTLYRTLFLCALVLFAVTFIINTVAELVRQRYRRRAAQL
jgi:hypothetical protein